MVVWKLAKELKVKNYQVIDECNKLMRYDYITKSTQKIPDDILDDVRKIFNDKDTNELSVEEDNEEIKNVAEDMILLDALANEVSQDVSDVRQMIRSTFSSNELKTNDKWIGTYVTTEIADSVKQFYYLKELTPTQYFEDVKNKKQQITEDELKKVYDNALTLINAYLITGQKKACRRLAFLIHTIEKEIEIVRKGYTTFIYKEDIEVYIEKVSKEVVKIIDLPSYPRDIPTDIIEKIQDVKDYFDKMYVIFTDYTGETEKAVAKERREKDPILVGAFETDGMMSNRMYFIGDWVDKYCDLTLDKMVSEYSKDQHKDIIRKINTPQDLEQLKLQLGIITENECKYVQIAKEPGDDLIE